MNQTNATQAVSVDPADDKTPSVPLETIIAADFLAGREYTAVERELMAPTLGDWRKTLIALREHAVRADTAPATTFDPRPPGMTTPTGENICELSAVPLPEYNGDPETLAFCTAADLARLIYARKVTSMELTEMYLARLKKHAPSLFCVVNLTEELAREQATRADAEIAAGNYRGPLHGIPYGAKDLLATKGIPTTYGAKPYETQILDYDATVISKLAEAGAVLCAKLSMGELAMDDVWFGGQTRCPWDTGRGQAGRRQAPAVRRRRDLSVFLSGRKHMARLSARRCETGLSGCVQLLGRSLALARWPFAGRSIKSAQ